MFSAESLARLGYSGGDLGLAAGLRAPGNRTGVPFPARSVSPSDPWRVGFLAEPGCGDSGQPGYAWKAALRTTALYDSLTGSPAEAGADRPEDRVNYGGGGTAWDGLPGWREGKGHPIPPLGARLGV